MAKQPCLTISVNDPSGTSRKNWLFSGSPKRAAVYGVIEISKANNSDPFKYLPYLFTKLSNMDFTIYLDRMDRGFLGAGDIQ
jgi:hypothetical protein